MINVNIDIHRIKGFGARRGISIGVVDCLLRYADQLDADIRTGHQ
ncbi:hypothetical protein ACWGCC_01295 [Streptomyces nigrescens]